jgi:predicted neuraminidase
MRCDAGTIWRSMSTDRGRTWSQGSPTTIINPGTQFFVCKLASRRWLLINSPDPTARTGIVAMLSEDEGKTWGPPLMLDERTDVSYPDACQAADGTIYAVHDRERHGAMEILLSVFNEGDLG